MGVIGLAVIVGIGLIVTVTLAVFVQLFASVPVTTYVIVLDGLADTVVPVVADSPPDGDHVNDEAPPAVNVVD